MTGALQLDGIAQPGERTRVSFVLKRPIGLEPGMRFSLREGKKTIGAGRVLTVR